MTCGERRPAQFWGLKSDNLRGDRARPALESVLPQLAGGTHELALPQPAGGAGKQSYLNQLGEGGDKHNLDQWESAGDQTQLPPGDKKIIVSGRDLSLVHGIVGVRGFPCMGNNTAQRGAMTCWGTENPCGSGTWEADVLDFRVLGDGYYNMRDE